MSLPLIVASVALLFAVIITSRYLMLRRKIKELNSKTSFAVKEEELVKVTFESNGELGQIASDFNKLASRYTKTKKDNLSLHSETKEKKNLDQKLKGVESSLSQITLLTEIGKEITGSLDVEHILQILFTYVSSSMEVENLNLLYYTDSTAHTIRVNKDGKLDRPPHSKENSSILEWCLDNGKEAFLNNAVEDYSQYVFDPIASLDGSYNPAAIMCIPFSLHDSKLGALSVESKIAEVYNSYHLDFLRTLVSYLAVALDNVKIYELLDESKSTLEQEKHKSDKLLLNILPSEIADELKENGEAVARKFDSVSILFTDFKEFTRMSQELSPEELVADINYCFKAFDAICDKYNIEKIKTIGDSYMAAGGIPVPDANSVKNTILAAFEMKQFIMNDHDKRKRLGKTPFQMRIGINTGPVVAGIVGVKKFQYDIWGDAVNTASRMESHGEVGRINISHYTYELLKDDEDLKFEHRGKIQAKGKGEVDMYFVDVVNIK